MDIQNRKWWIKIDEVEEGPIEENDFQSRLRSGKIPLGVLVKSNMMDTWEELLKIVSTDETFKRPSKMPPRQ